MSAITESEKKRLRSLKEKKQMYKAKGQLIQQALSNLDNTTNNKKIIFDDVDEGTQLKPKKTKRDLFDSDDDNNEKDSLWNEDQFKIKKSKKTLGNDARFTLDDRFMEDNQTEESKIVDDTDECNLQKEKEKQLDILEGILGVPLTVKNQEKPTKKGLMIRYDPTENKHCEYEVKPAQPKIKEKKEAKKKKCDKLMSKIEEPALLKPDVSKDIYYTVSDVLTESLKQKGEFSLLKTYGKEKEDAENIKDNDTSIVESNKVQRFNFNANNVFKYDSSDEENEASNINDQVVDEAKEDTQQNNLFSHKDTLFLDSNDVRFNEAIKFFTTKAPNDELRNLRRELKAIVRMKIRNNERKLQPYGKKRKIKKFK